MEDESHALRLKKDVKQYVQESFTARFYWEGQANWEYGRRKRRKRTSESLEMKRFKALLCILTTPPGHTTLRVNLLQFTKEEVKACVETKLKEMYSDRTIEPPEVAYHPVVKDLLVMKNRGPFTDLPKHHKEVIVDLACGMSVLRGADVFAQGIMAANAAMNVNDEVSVYADVAGQCRKGYLMVYEGRKLFVGNGVAAVGRKELFMGRDIAISGVGVRMTNPVYDAPCLADFLPSQVYPQNLPSVVCGHVLDPQPGENVLDMCAAPGGKTTHIAALMKNQGRVVALDKSDNKVAHIKERAEKWGISIIEAYTYDSTNVLCAHAIEDEKPPYRAASFDRILLDAPCSALGQRPALITPLGLRDVKSFPVLQRKLFRNAVGLLREGGTLVYSTCSIPMQENECMVQWALEEFPNLQLVEQVPFLGVAGYPGSRLPEDQLGYLQRFDPAADTDISARKYVKITKAEDVRRQWLSDNVEAKFPDAAYSTANTGQQTPSSTGSGQAQCSDKTEMETDACSCTHFDTFVSCPVHSTMYTEFSAGAAPKMEDSASGIDMADCDADTIGFFIAKFIKVWWS